MNELHFETLKEFEIYIKQNGYKCIEDFFNKNTTPVTIDKNTYICDKKYCWDNETITEGYDKKVIISMGKKRGFMWKVIERIRPKFIKGF